MREFSLYQAADSKNYKIIFSSLATDVGDYNRFVGKQFIVSDENDNEIMRYVIEMDKSIFDNIDVSAKDHLLTRVGFLDIFSALDNGNFSIKKRVISNKSELGCEEQDWFLKYPKFCVFREKAEKGFICTISELGNKTKFSIDCEHCLLQEDFFRCKHLIATKDKGNTISGSVIFARCEIGKSIDTLKTGECLNKACFRPSLIQSENLKLKFGTSSKDAHIHQCIDLIDKINTLCEQKYRFKLFVIHQHKAIIDLMQPCLSEDNFTKLVLILANVIDWINVASLKSEVKKIPKEAGSLNLLEEFLTQNSFTSAQILIKRLRRIKSISNKYPRHKDRPELVSDFKELGFTYPPSSWSDLWNVIIRDFLCCLVELKEFFN